ncbi:MAG: ABC transporter ATP-binding protein [Candidatus Omnitrophica bacterium]|nr:ABC transporter ATP-binding protein [Candidatus Omnitrophota bacterium]
MNFFPYCGHQHAHPHQHALAIETWDACANYIGHAQSAITDINIAVPSGTCVALVGHNGAGKSTLLKVAAGLLPLRSGRIQILGHPIGQCHQRVVYLPQRSEIDWRFPISVRKLVGSGRYVHLGWLRYPNANDHKAIEEALRELDILDLAERQISQLSGGQQQRVLLARAICQDADLFLLDEPLNAIDVQTQAIVARVLKDLRKSGKTVVVATHFIDKLSAQYDGAVYLNEGRQVQPAQGNFTGIPIGKK